MTMQQFWANLKKRGYEIKAKKLLYLKPPGSDYFCRIERHFGHDYSVEGIADRILAQRARERVLPEPEREFKKVPFKGETDKVRKITGFRALYIHYCFILGYIPTKTPHCNKRLHFLLREDLLKMEAISNEVRLLARCHIDTAEQLSSYQESLEAKIEAVKVKRKGLYKRQRTVSVKSDEQQLEALKADIDALSAELKTLRKEVRLCEGIAERSGIMLEKLRKVQKEANKEKEEKTRDEQFRRRGGTGR